MMRRVRGASALIALLALSVGLPLALAATVGNPLHARASIAAGDMSDQDVIAIMAAVAYLAWATFAVALLVEVGETFAAAFGRRERRAVRIPLLGAQQDLARTLIAGVLLLAPAVVSMVGPVTSAFAAAPASAVTDPVPHATPGHAIAPDADRPPTSGAKLSAEPSAIRYRIPEQGGMRSYWALAEHYLGDGQRWPDIWQFNEGRRQPDGSVMTSPQLLHRGWTVLIPPPVAAPPAAADDEHDVTVHIGDTLSGLAAEDGVQDWATVWRENGGRVEPSGDRFTDPNLIKPGWTISIPGAGGPAPTRARHGQPGSPAPSPHRSSPGRRHVAPGPPTPVATSTPVGPAPAVPDGDHRPASGDRERATGHESAFATLPLAAFTAGGGFLAGVSFTALLRHRRRQFRWRGAGRMIGETPSRLRPIERALVGASAGVADVTWLDQALRGLVVQIADCPGGQLPDVIAACIDQESLELVLTTPRHDPPPPWRTDELGTRWRISRDDDMGYDPEQKAYHYAPFPTLSSVGYSADGQNWLLDLERVTAMSLVGDPRRCLNLARYLAAELAHNNWSEELQITLVGFGAEMAALNPGRLSHTDDLDAAVAALHRQFDDIGAAADDAGVGVLEGRLRNVAGDVWAPHVLLIAPAMAANRAGLDRLLNAMRTRAARTAIALVLAEEPSPRTAAASTRWQLEVTEDGIVRIPALGLELIAQQLPVDEAADLAALLALAAGVEDRPMPPGRGDQPWDDLADAAGAPRPEITTAPSHGPAGATAEPVIGIEGNRSLARRTLLPLPTETYLQQSAVTAEDVETLAPIVSSESRRRIEEADPGLNEDLAEWRSPDSLLPKLSLLGTPTVRGARGSLPAGRPRVAFYTEVLAYLATRPGTTAAQLGMALWPNDPNIAEKTTVRQAVAVVRKWLGVNPRTGGAHVPYGGDGSSTGVYRVEGLLIDAELFRRLRLRAVARGAAGDGIADLAAALELVSGVPIEHHHVRRRRGKDAAKPGDLEPYSWLVEDNLDTQYAAMITDVAHTVATHFLAAGEPVRAAEAAQVALLAGSAADDPLCDLVLASDAQDRHAEGDEYVRRIMANHDAEVEEDLPPRTYEILLRRRYSQAG
jgi:hypothetical protein